MSKPEPVTLGPYEHVFDDKSHGCVLCGWRLPRTLPAGTPYGCGAYAITMRAELHSDLPSYTWLVERGPFVVEKKVHAGWIDWSEAIAPLCKGAP